MRWLITGANSKLGRHLLAEAQRRGLDVTAWTGHETGGLHGYELQPVDLEAVSDVSRPLDAVKPDVVLHLAAIASVAEAHRDPYRAWRFNREITGCLAEAVVERGARFVQASTDMVFDGEHAPYREENPAEAVSVYGHTKRGGEEMVLRLPGTLVVRLSLLHGPMHTRQPAFFDQLVQALREGKPITVFRDEWRTPLSAKTAAQAMLALGESEHSGILHVGGPERMSRQEMAIRLARYLGLESAAAMRVVDRAAVPAPEPRPRDVSLDSSRWRALFPNQPWPKLEEAWAEMGLMGRL